jgi:hypothetical protein
MSGGLSDERTIELLRTALPAAAEPPSDADLWPAVKDRVMRRQDRLVTADLLLVAAIVLLCLLRPSLAAIVFLHF